MTVFIGNLSCNITADDLEEVFADYGAVKRVKVPTDRETGQMRGFAFVDMASEAEEAAAIEDLDGAEWMGRTLKVNKARPREERPSGGRRYGGGGGRNGGSPRY